jgi:hypothetical protein
MLKDKVEKKIISKQKKKKLELICQTYNLGYELEIIS